MVAIDLVVSVFINALYPTAARRDDRIFRDVTVKPIQEILS
jgi:hypothetical protein